MTIVDYVRCFSTVLPTMSLTCRQKFTNVSHGTPLPRALWRHRFSAFWLRSKCSICSYQLNIWYVPHWGTSILNWFLELGEDAGACSDFSTGWPGIAVPPGSAHSHQGVIKNQKLKNPLNFLSISLSLYLSTPPPPPPPLRSLSMYVPLSLE